MIKIGRNSIVSNFLFQREIKNNWMLDKCFVNTVPDSVLEKARNSKLGFVAKGPSVEEPKKLKKKELPKSNYIESNRDYKFIYPEFLPDSTYFFRDKLREKLERRDMIERRKQINMPEFYVGSILAVNVSDPYAPGKTNRFVGICIRREGHQLRHSFTVRNVIDGMGVEIQYDLYNPTMQSIEVLKLEKRLDDNLTYLQDCPPEYSTIPFDMQPFKHPPGVTVPLNTIKVPLNKRPWRFRWERKDLKGVIYPELKRFEYEEYVKSYSDFKPYERYDMMKQYRKTIHDDDYEEIVQDIKTLEKDVQNKQDVIIGSKKLIKARSIPSDSSSINKK